MLFVSIRMYAEGDLVVPQESIAGVIENLILLIAFFREGLLFICLFDNCCK